MKATDQIDALVKQAKESLRNLAKVLLEGLKPSGPHAFFYFNGHCLERLENCQTIVHRLVAGRQRLTELGIEEAAIEHETKPHRSQYPETLQRVYREEHRVGLEMRLDMESLYVFGRMMLDQWSLQVGIVCNTPARRPSFSKLVNWFETADDLGSAAPIWNRLQGPLLWLHYHLQFYRNKVVVHPERPWQRGTSMDTIGDDFRLDILTPPGWMDEASTFREIQGLRSLVPENSRRQFDSAFHRHPSAAIEFLMGRIQLVPSPIDRGRIAECYRKIGGSTPSFQTVGYHFFSLIATGTALLIPIAQINLRTIDLGKPFISRSR